MSLARVTSRGPSGPYREPMEVRRTLDRYGDVALAVVLAAGATAELAAWADHDLAASVPFALLMTLPLALRRSAPVASLVMVMVGTNLLLWRQPGFDNDSAVLVLSFLLTLYSVGRHARGVEAWLGGAALVVVMAEFVRSESTSPDLGDFAFVVAFVGAPWAAGLTLRLRREREGFLNRENERLRLEQAEREARAVAEERSRIARELHDVVSHAISVTVLQARGARRTLDDDPAAARRALDAIETTNTAALGDMRRLLAVLRDTEPDHLDREPLPSLAHLDRLIDGVRGSGVPVDLDVVGAPRAVPPGVDLSAYRILQEGLTNVVKHASGPARVTVEYADDALSVAIENDGDRTADAMANGSGHGLIGIRERVAVVGGEVTAGPLDEGGYRVRARLPYSVETS